MTDPPPRTSDAPTAEPRPGMKGSLRIARVAGIDIGVHWTFWLLVPFVVYIAYSRGGDAADAVRLLGFVVALFVCVVLHELGHALTARRFGIRTRDITLLPIGGMARLERMPERPMHELVIAVAGPLVNVVIAALLLAVILATGTPLLTQAAGGEADPAMLEVPFLVNLAFVNVILVLFNMLPAFPMDGGRVLRAILATQMDYARATDIAAKVGAGMAILFVALALFTGNLILGLIAVFVFIGGQAESRAAQTRSAIQGLTVRHAMVTEFRALDADAALRDAVEALLAGSQQDFPVTRDGRLVGMLYRHDLVRAIAEGGIDRRVSEIMDEGAPTLRPDAPLEAATESLRDGRSAIPVVEGGRIAGVLTAENVGELIMIKGAAARGAAV